MCAEAFVADVTTSIRRSLFQRLKTHGFSQSELTGIIAGAAKAAVLRARVSDLATLAGAARDMAETLGVSAPDDPALAAFLVVKDNLPDDVRILVDPFS